MYTMLSRNDRLWERLIELAKLRTWSYQTNLYPSEIKRIQKQWKVTVVPLKENDGMKIPCILHWKHAFPDGIDVKYALYISGEMDEMPQVENFAQQLYLLAARA